MEADSKKKRGRPNVYSYVGMEDIRQQILEDKGSRTTQNELYIMDAISAVDRLTPTGSECYYFIPDGISQLSTQELKRAGYKRDSTILEQLGRALTQDGLPDDSFIVLAEKAAEWKRQGHTSKEVAAQIRQVRTIIKSGLLEADSDN